MSPMSIKRRVGLALAALAILASALGVAGAPLLDRLGTEGIWLAAWLAAIVLLVVLLARRAVGWALRPLAGASTVIEALRDGDYSLRLREARLGGLDELAHSINLLAEKMRAEALERRESGLLLGKVLDEIELPVLAFRDDGVLTLSNPAARSLIGLKLHDGITAEALGLSDLRGTRADESIRLVLPGGSGRFVVRERGFRLGGIPHRLLVLAEVGGVLSAERNEAWQGLVRVMSHEINNSLSPIKSMAETWRQRASDASHELDRARLAENLDLISRRSASLSRFVGIYAGLARLPEPSRRSLRLDALIAKVCALEARVAVDRCGGPTVAEADPDQIEQALINLVRNAVEASLDQSDPEVSIRWGRSGQGVHIDVVDNGPGPPESKNLFVPFFTTKPDGSGIGLLLVRRIAELHDGWFELHARSDGRSGAVARLWLPEPVGVHSPRPARATK